MYLLTDDPASAVEALSDNEYAEKEYLRVCSEEDHRPEPEFLPVPMAEEPWEVESSRMEREPDSNEETLDRYA